MSRLIYPAMLLVEAACLIFDIATESPWFWIPLVASVFIAALWRIDYLRARRHAEWMRNFEAKWRRDFGYSYSERWNR